MTNENKSSNVVHPSHYNSDPSGVECIDIVRHRNFNVGNAIKYLWRAGLKNDASMDINAKTVEDLEKAVFYINDEIKRISPNRTEIAETRTETAENRKEIDEIANLTAKQFWKEDVKNILKILLPEGRLINEENIIKLINSIRIIKVVELNNGFIKQLHIDEELIVALEYYFTNDDNQKLYKSLHV